MSRQQANVKITRSSGVARKGWCVSLPLLAAIIATIALAEGPSATLTLSGSVGRVVAVSVTPQNDYNSLDLANGETEKTVAIINELSNDKAGYTVTLSSLGAGLTGQAQLRPATPGNPDTIPYSLEYDGMPVKLNRGNATLTTAGGRTSSAGANNTLAVSIAPAAGVNADFYSDTLQLTIQGN